jgi:hypothetical protein
MKIQQSRRTHTSATTAAPGGGNSHLGLSKVSEFVKLTITGSPTGGTFTLTVLTQTTGAIAYNAAPVTVQLALEALTNIGSGGVRVYADTPGDLIPTTPYTIEFTGHLARVDITTVTATSSLTGGSSPAITLSVSQNGAGAGRSFRPVLGGYDDQQSVVQIESESPIIPMNPTSNALNIRTGTVTNPVESATTSQNSAMLWRGNTFSKRIPW